MTDHDAACEDRAFAAPASDAPDMTTAERGDGLSIPRVPSNRERALWDLLSGLAHYRLWWWMAFTDIKRRYRRTLIGPFWTTLSHAIFVGAIGVLWAGLWKMDMSTYLPYLAAGLLTWIFVSTVVNEACTIFPMSGGLMGQTRLPYSLFIYAMVSRNMLVFCHHLIVFIVIAVLFQVEINLKTLLVVPGLVLSCLMAGWIAILVGIVCTRFRDIQQIVMSFLQIVMFITPIFWTKEHLTQTRVGESIINLNLFHHWIAVVREPLLGRVPDALNYGVIIAAIVLGWIGTFAFFARYRRYIILWL